MLTSGEYGFSQNHGNLCLERPSGLSPRWNSSKEPVCQCRRLNRQGVQSLGQEDPLEKELTTCSTEAGLEGNQFHFHRTKSYELHLHIYSEHSFVLH